MGFDTSTRQEWHPPTKCERGMNMARTKRECVAKSSRLACGFSVPVPVAPSGSPHQGPTELLSCCWGNRALSASEPVDALYTAQQTRRKRGAFFKGFHFRSRARRVHRTHSAPPSRENRGNPRALLSRFAPKCVLFVVCLRAPNILIIAFRKERWSDTDDVDTGPTTTTINWPGLQLNFR